ncbi:hypothetical protein [Thiocapsa rosea]|uniref:Uncharacterized protein n=1 Tax=Thiocapsa rosea TaxID=69360 RepID=A0A495V4L4_9GAMM|nr:hypothetical protein [Thiocapsa rosea]RKT43267.1 hypothetical protein BDD21_0589 [Thiocapsa rosea]
MNDRLSYDQLYREALSDPELKRTREELEAAMSNAREARRVVFELFQDLDRFSLDDYQPLADIDEGKARLVAFLRAAVEDQGGRYRKIDACRFELTLDARSAPILCTLDRDLAQTDDELVLMGLDHPVLSRLSEQWRAASPAGIGAVTKGDLEQPAVLSMWWVQSFGGGSGSGAYIIPIAVDLEGRRVPAIEKRYRDVFRTSAAHPVLKPSERAELMHGHIEPTLQRELSYRGIASPEKGYASELVAWVEVR